MLFRIISSSNFREADIRIDTDPKISITFFLSNIRFGHVKKTETFHLRNM